MEHLFLPCTRLHDIVESKEIFRELKLNVSTEELLSSVRAFTYADLYAMLGNRKTVLWLTPHAVVVRRDEEVVYAWWMLGESRRFYLNVDGKGIVVLARSPEDLLEICDVISRLLAASVAQSVCLGDQCLSSDYAPVNATTLANMMEQYHSLKALTLGGTVLDDDHIRVLGTFCRPNLEIKLKFCTFTSAGLSALVEVLGRNQGPTNLYCCYIDNAFLADGLRGNTSLKSLRPCFSHELNIGNQELFAIAGALKGNKGLVDLEFRHTFRISDEAWDAFCDSLKTHPTLQTMELRSAHPPLALAVLTSRIQALVDMLKVNMSIHAKRLRAQYIEHELFRGSVIPYLETNLLRRRVLAIKKTLPVAYRAKVLGKALLAVRTDSNRFWMLLSGNSEIVDFASTTATTTRAACFNRRFFKCCKCCYNEH
jgi:hypothetical protein